MYLVKDIKYLFTINIKEIVKSKGIDFQKFTPYIIYAVIKRTARDKPYDPSATYLLKKQGANACAMTLNEHAHRISAMSVFRTYTHSYLLMTKSNLGGMKWIAKLLEITLLANMVKI